MTLHRTIAVSDFLSSIRVSPIHDILSLFFFLLAVVHGTCLLSCGFKNPTWLCLIDILYIMFWDAVGLSDICEEVSTGQTLRNTHTEMTFGGEQELEGVQVVMNTRKATANCDNGMLRVLNVIFIQQGKLAHIAEFQAPALSIIASQWPIPVWTLVNLYHLVFLSSIIGEARLGSFLDPEFLEQFNQSPSKRSPRLGTRLTQLLYVTLAKRRLSSSSMVRSSSQVVEEYNEVDIAFTLALLRRIKSSAVVRMLTCILPTPNPRLCQLSLKEILDNKDRCRLLLKSKKEKAQLVLDVMQKILDRRDTPEDLKSRIWYEMIRLPTLSGIFPRSWRLQSIVKGEQQFTSGGHADIFKGSCGNFRLCLKVPRLSVKADNESLLREITREASLWGPLEHPNILPLYGIYPLGDQHGHIALVSPWVENGTLSNYLERCPSVSRISLISDILEGLQYLHGKGIVHQDLKAANILISPGGHALLADFGVASVVNANVARWTSVPTMTRTGGTIRWMAPELFENENDEGRHTFASDIYSLGCVMYEVFTGHDPFYEIPEIATVLKAKVDEQQIPIRPEAFNEIEQSNEIWEIMQSCWNPIPGGRLSLKQIYNALHGLSLLPMIPSDHQLHPTPQTRAQKARLTMMDVVVLDGYSV